MLGDSFGVGGGGGGGGGGAVAADPALAALAARVASGLRARVAAVLPRAFSRLPLPRAAALLGFPAGTVEGAAAFEAFVAGQGGWEACDGALSLPRPPVAALAAPSSAGASAASAAAAAAALTSSEDELAKLSKYILQLEAGA